MLHPLSAVHKFNKLAKEKESNRHNSTVDRWTARDGPRKKIFCTPDNTSMEKKV